MQGFVKWNPTNRVRVNRLSVRRTRCPRFGVRRIYIRRINRVPAKTRVLSVEIQAFMLLAYDTLTTKESGEIHSS